MNNKPKQRKANKLIGEYILTSNVLGKGQFGEVVLARGAKAEDKNHWMACKIIKKSSLNRKL